MAGSERIGEDDMKQSEETGFINKSLFVLSNVVHKLAEGKKKLTNFLIILYYFLKSIKLNYSYNNIKHYYYIYIFNFIYNNML